MSTTEMPPPMRPWERPSEYTKRTGYYPPHWTSDRCREQDAKIHTAELAGNHEYVKRWGR